MPRHNAQRAHRTITGALFFFHATRKRGVDERFSPDVQAIVRPLPSPSNPPQSSLNAIA